MWDLLICSNCKNLLKNPKILGCGHSLCGKCLKVISRRQEPAKCPSCNCVIRSHGDNFFLSCVLDVLKREIDACNVGMSWEACFADGGLGILQCVDVHEGVSMQEKDVMIRGSIKNNDEIKRQDLENEFMTTKLNGNGELTMENEVFSENDNPILVREDKVNTLHENDIPSKRHKISFSRKNQRIHALFKCKKHENEELRFFCSSCSQLVCQECVITEHLLHIFLSVSDAAPSCRAQMRTLFSQSMLRLLYLSDALRETMDIEDKLRIRMKDITDEIHCLRAFKVNPKDQCVDKTKINDDVIRSFKDRFHNMYKDLSSSLTDSEEMSKKVHEKTKVSPQRNKDTQKTSKNIKGIEEILIESLRKKTRMKHDILAKHRRKLNTLLTLIQSAQKFTIRLCLNATDVEILILEGCVIESLGQLCQNTPEAPIECPEDSFITLEKAESAEELQRFHGNEPKITRGRGCASCCFATGEGIAEATIGKDSVFTVTIKNEENKACWEGRDSIVARLKTPNGGYFFAELIEHKHGRLKFRYRSYSAGLHLLRITLRGEEILGSPFEILCHGSTDYSRRGGLVTKFGRSGSNKEELCRPQGLAVDRLSRIIVADTGNHRIQVFDQYGRYLFTYGRKGTGESEFNEPFDVAISRTGHVIVADCLNGRLQFFTPNGNFVREMSLEDKMRPVAVTTDLYDNVIVADADQNRVVVISMWGERQRTLSRGSSTSIRQGEVQDVACNQTGETYVTFRALNSGITQRTNQDNVVEVYDNSGTFIREYFTPAYAGAEPTLCRLVTDNDERVLVTGSGNKVQVFTRLGGHLTNITFKENENVDINLTAIVLSPNEAVVVADALNGRIFVF